MVYWAYSSQLFCGERAKSNPTNSEVLGHSDRAERFSTFPSFLAFGFGLSFVLGFAFPRVVGLALALAGAFLGGAFFEGAFFWGAFLAAFAFAVVLARAMVLSPTQNNMLTSYPLKGMVRELLNREMITERLPSAKTCVLL